LNNQLIAQYYETPLEGTFYNEMDHPSHRVCTVIMKLFLGTINNKGPLNKADLLNFVELSFTYSREELIDKIYTNSQIVELGNTLSADLKEAYVSVLEMFLKNQLFPIDELYSIRQANPKYKSLEIACLYCGLQTLDIENYVMSDLASELSPSQRKKLNYGDESMILD
jgi:hypothetical protein